VSNSGDGPVFICGAERSGTSLMYALLASHPQLSMIRRANMWRWFYGKFGDLGDPENLDAAIDALERYKRLAPLEADWERVRREFDEGPPTYGRLFDLPHRHRAERIGRARWGDKSLHSEYFAREIFTEFPDARVIHMVRDPRDRYASIANRYEHSSKGIASATGRWLASVRAGETNMSRYPDRYSVVRFEDLLEDPLVVTSQTCAFIGEAFDPEMMKMSGAPEHSHGNSSFGDLAPKTISTAPMGRYRTKLRPADIAFIQLVAGGPMRRHGYAIDAVDLRGAERWRFAAVTAPRDSCRLAYWSLNQRRHQAEERPPATRLVDAE
jgi:hypothetical protein